MKTKEAEPSCLACGKPLAQHEALTWTCHKVQKLRNQLRAVLGCRSAVLSPIQDRIVTNAMDALEETA
jgi:hypothetical protein